MKRIPEYSVQNNRNANFPQFPSPFLSDITIHCNCILIHKKSHDCLRQWFFCLSSLQKNHISTSDLKMNITKNYPLRWDCITKVHVYAYIWWFELRAGFFLSPWSVLNKLSWNYKDFRIDMIDNLLIYSMFFWYVHNWDDILQLDL